MRNVSDKPVETSKQFVFSNIFQKSSRLYDNVENCGAKQATGDNMVHAHCMLNT